MQGSALHLTKALQTFKDTVWPCFLILCSCLILLIFSNCSESNVPRVSTTLSPSPGGAVAKSKVKDHVFIHSVNISSASGSLPGTENTVGPLGCLQPTEKDG